VYADPVNVIEGAEAPVFKGIDFDDKEFDLDKYYKKNPIVLNFFSVRCVSCLTVVKILERFKDNNKIKDEIAFVYISLDDWKKEAHIPSVWKEVFDGSEMRLNDGTRKIGRLYEVDTLPVTVIIDKAGKVFYRRDDYNMNLEKEVNKKLETFLQK
jgi:peroxiredoxin